MRYFIIILSSLIFTLGLQAKTVSNYWVYQTIETEVNYQIIRINATNNISENITNFPKTPSFNLSSILPDEERILAEEWLVGSIPPSIEYEFPSFGERPPRFFLGAVVPSPDNTQLAIVVYYDLCPGQTGECFGLSRILIHDIATGEYTVLWDLPMNANTPFFPACDTSFTYTGASLVQTRILRPQWLFNGSVLATRISYISSHYSRDYPLIVVPINAPENAFALGCGASDWIVSPDSRHIVSISRHYEEDPVVRIIELDLENNQHSFQIYPQTPDIMGFPEIFYPVFLQNQLVFPVEKFHLHVGALGHIYCLGQLDIIGDDGMSLVEGDISSFRFIRSSPSSNVLIVEDTEGLLWQLNLIGNGFSLVSVVQSSVQYWQFASDDELVVQFENDEQYSIVMISEAIFDN